MFIFRLNLYQLCVKFQLRYVEHAYIYELEKIDESDGT